MNTFVKNNSLLIIDSFDRDALKYIDAVEQADGEKLEPGIRKAINSFIVGCKSDNTWDAIKASCILAGARTLEGALIPLVGAPPTNNNFIANDYNREIGLKGNGIDKYLNTNRQNNIDPQNSKHFLVYTTANDPVQSAFGGGLGLAPDPSIPLQGTQIIQLDSSRMALAINSRGGWNFSSYVVGLHGVSRQNSTTVFYINNGIKQEISNQSFTPSNENIWVFARSIPSPYSALHTTARIAFYSIGEHIDLELINNRISALINDIGESI